MKKCVNFIKENLSNFLAYLATLFSIICALTPVFVGRTLFAVVTAVIGILCLLILVYYLYATTNKSQVLQLLSDEKRSQAIQLLLIYESSKHHNKSDNKTFQSGNLHIKRATYKYTVKRNHMSDGPFDLQCNWTFELKSLSNSNSINFLISQPRGKETHTITYIVNDKSFNKKVTSCRVNNHSGFKGFLQCTIPPQKGMKKLSIEFTMKEVYQTKTNGAFLTCPFFFAKTIDQLYIQCDYKEVQEKINPSSFSLFFYPYDGRKCKTENIGDFNTIDGSNSVWECSVIPEKTCAQAIYITQVFHE